MPTGQVLRRATIVSLQDAARKTDTFQSAALNVKDFEGDIAITSHWVGGGTNPTLDGKIQESADGSTGWTDITGATFTQVVDAVAIETIFLSAKSTKGFIRYVGTVGGSSETFDGCVNVAGFKQDQ